MHIFYLTSEKLPGIRFNVDDLFPYQHLGIDFLVAKRQALLADEPGLGKTTQAIHGLDRIHAINNIIVCPSVARINWQREFEMWSGLKRDYQILYKLSDRPIPGRTVICSFDYASENSSHLAQIKWDAMVIDEAHFIKEPTSKRTAAIMGVKGFAHSAKRQWLLTGTPAPNHPGELWVILYTFQVTKLSYNDFIKRYCHLRPTPHGVRITGARMENIPELRAQLDKIMLRRLKKDVMSQLPSISYSHTLVEPGPVDVEILPSFAEYFIPTDKREKLMAVLEKEAEILRVMMKNTDNNDDTKQMGLVSINRSVSTIRRYLGLQKVAPTIEIIKGHFRNSNMQKLVIFAIHQDVIEGLRAGLREFNPVVLFGGTSPDKRQKNIDRFQKDPKCKIFIGNILAAGTAITLTAAHNVVFVEQDWVPGNNAQAVMRVHRIGQENKVFVRFILVDGTLDAKIGFILKKKVRELTRLLD